MLEQDALTNDTYCPGDQMNMKNSDIVEEDLVEDRCPDDLNITLSFAANCETTSCFSVDNKSEGSNEVTTSCIEFEAYKSVYVLQINQTDNVVGSFCSKEL